MTNNENLLFKILNAKNEDEVESIIESQESNLEWLPFNGDESNFATINNQQTDPIAALSEKPVNSIDSILIMKCKLAGIDPESKEAPQSMSQAVEKFFRIKDGDISLLSNDERRELAKNVRIIADGEKEEPNLMIVDFGEGQNPEDFEKTLLSLHRKNKSRIAFVQGKFGMGGTGVIPFCGNNKYQLVLSRKHPKLLEANQEDIWGFTIVRKTPANKLSKSDKHSWFEYFVDKNKKILSINGKPLKVLPENELMVHGCLIKLFNYELPRPSAVIFDLWRDLNRKLYSPALPIIIRENRLNHFTISKRKDYSIVMVGNKYRIKKDDRGFVEKTIAITANLMTFGERKIEIVTFKDFDSKGEDLRKRQEWTTNEEAVFLTINGQTHFSMPRYWLNKTGLDFLKDYLFVHIDCTDVKRTVTDDIFLGSRDRVRHNNDFREFQNSLLDILRNNSLLIKLNEEYKERQLSKIKPDKSIAKKLVGNLISKNRGLINYFTMGLDIPIKEPGKIEKIHTYFIELYIPTFLKPLKKFEGNFLVKEIPKNATHSVVLLETDAPNDYFDRNEDNGEFSWKSSSNKVIVSSWFMHNGIINLRMGMNNCEEGDSFDVEIKITRPNLEPLNAKFKVVIIKQKIKTQKEKREHKSKALGLPELVVVKEIGGENNEAWKQHNWNGLDISKVEKGTVYINMDSDDYRNYIQHCPKKLRVVAETVYKTSIYLNAIILDLELGDALNGKKDIAFNKAISSISKTILPLYLDKDLANFSSKIS